MMSKGLRILPTLAVMTLFLLCAAPGRAAEEPAPSSTSRLLFNGELVATEISKVTGCAISPILGISVLGAYTYYTTPLAGAWPASRVDGCRRLRQPVLVLTWR